MVLSWMFLPLETASRLTLDLYPGKGSLAVAQEEHQPRKSTRCQATRKLDPLEIWLFRRVTIS